MDKDKTDAKREKKFEEDKLFFLQVHIPYTLSVKHHGPFRWRKQKNLDDVPNKRKRDFKLGSNQQLI